MSIDGGVDSQSMEHTPDGILYTHEKEENSGIFCNMNDVVLCEMTQSHRQPLSDSLI